MNTTSEFSYMSREMSFEKYKQRLQTIDVTDVPPLLSSISKGDQPKWFVPELNIYIKQALFYQDKQWRDYMVETISYQVGKQLGFDVVEQHPCLIKNEDEIKIGSFSHNFLRKDELFITFWRIANMRIEGFEFKLASMEVEDRAKLILAVMSEYIDEERAKEFLFQQAVIDLLVGNEDRHLNNFGFIKNINGQFRTHPIFDSGLGLFEHDIKHDGRPLESSIRVMRSRMITQKHPKAYKVISQVTGREVQGSLDISRIYFPSKKARDYFEQAAEFLGLKIRGKGIIVHEGI